MLTGGVSRDCFSARIISVGDASVGKTALFVRFVHNSYSADQKSDGRDFLDPEVDRMPQGKMELRLWDTSGTERYRSVTRQYLRDADGVCVCFDITVGASFQSVPMWCDEVKEESLKEPVVILLGLKVDRDQDRVVSARDAEAWATAHGVAYFETSALAERVWTRRLMRWSRRSGRRSGRGRLERGCFPCVRVTLGVALESIEVLSRWLAASSDGDNQRRTTVGTHPGRYAAADVTTGEFDAKAFVMLTAAGSPPLLPVRGPLPWHRRSRRAREAQPIP
jgi:small GTP-binding protein